MDFPAYQVERDRLDSIAAAASAALQRFPRGPMGLTPDAVKASPEWKAARAAYAVAADNVRRFNGAHAGRFAPDLRAERDARRRTRLTA